jgi:hypothetical protein
LGANPGSLGFILLLSYSGTPLNNDLFTQLWEQPWISYFTAELQELPSEQLPFYPVLGANPGSLGFTLLLTTGAPL